MKAQLDQYIKTEEKLRGELIGISIRSALTGEKRYDHMGNTRFSPASNLKLLTAAAAISVLGEDYTFSTEIRTNGEVKGNKLEGNLYLKGKGDPTLMPEDLEKFANEIQSKGIISIEGDILADDTWYDNVRLSADLNWNDEQYHYGAQVSALTVSPDENYDAGSVIVEVIPGNTIGARPIVHLSPGTDYIQIINEAVTVSANKEAELLVERKHAENTVIVKGTISLKGEIEKERMSVWNPTTYALHLFKQALLKHGITWSGTVRAGGISEQTNMLLNKYSIPLARLLVPFMKQSNNGHGEALVKEMGKVIYGKGSWEKGIEVMKAELSKFKIDMDSISIRDGSGISHFNLIPPNEISMLLYEVQQKEWFSTYLHSLPIAGNGDWMVGGTLRERMHGLLVQAKTGTIHGVSTLAGYTETKKGERLIFSIMINHLLDEDEGKVIEDELMKIIIDEG
ncbi:D-alanyl-D-alanine carboxypeptidase/D-alanyl-D-alanine endopeptidase [Virgibacillus ainsalahensis]